MQRRLSMTLYDAIFNLAKIEASPDRLLILKTVVGKCSDFSINELILHSELSSLNPEIIESTIKLFFEKGMILCEDELAALSDNRDIRYSNVP